MSGESSFSRRLRRAHLTASGARAWLPALLCVCAVSLLAAPLASASSQIVQTPQPLQSGCPSAAGQAPEPGSHCIPVSVSMVQDEYSDSGGCGQSVFMQVPLLKGIAEYGALWTNSNKGATPWLFTATGGRHGAGSGPYGEEQYSTTALTPQNTGVNVNYKVPNGFGAWFVSAGGGPPPCDLEPGTAVAWAWTARYAVTGTVEVAGVGGLPAANVRMQANCPSGGTTTTNALGDYEFTLDRGPCTIAPQLSRGEHATPARRRLNVTHNISRVDFQVPCDAVNDAAAAADIARAAAGTPCQLDVTVTVAPSAPHAGLIRDPAAYSPAFWGAGTSPDGQNAGNCKSGCVDLLVTVTDHRTHVAVPGATINAVVPPIRPVSGTFVAPYPAGIGPGDGFLCTPSPTGKTTACGEVTSASDLSRLTAKTDDYGHVLLRYWAPGLASDSGTTGSGLVGLRVLATKACSSNACPRHKLQGQYTGHFNVYSTQLYAGSFTPPVWFTNAWAQFASGSLTITALWQKLASYIPGGAAASAEDWWVNWLLSKEFSPTLPTDGLGGPSWSVLDPKAWVTLVPQLFTNAYENFDDALLGAPGVDDGYAGYSMFGQLGRTLFNSGDQNTQMQLHLTVYEVSSCDAEQLCGPGYETTPSVGGSATAATLTTPGVHPFLYFSLTAKDPNEIVVYRGGFIIPYQAETWIPQICAGNAAYTVPFCLGT